MLRAKGRHFALSPCRRFITDLLYFGFRVHSAAVERRMNLAPLVQARRLATPKPGWSALFLKAYALAAARHPELRRAYMKFPWPHLYEHPENVATIAVLRRLGDEEAVFFAHLRAPDRWSLTKIGAYLRRCREDPLTSIGSFRRMLRVSRWPWPLRRLAWWLGLNVHGKARARFFGTFGLSVIAGLGASQFHTPSPLTSSIYYGQFEPNGALPVRLTFDHRVFDGALVARALCEVEAILLGEILEEVRSLGAAAA